MSTTKLFGRYEMRFVNYNPLRNVYIHKKADMNSLQNYIDQVFTDHLKNKDNLTNSVEDNWKFFKDTIVNPGHKHVPI